MNMDEKTYREYDIIYRYKKSISFDAFLSVFSCVIFATLGGAIDYGRFDFVQYIFYALAILCFGFYFISDLVLKGASIGKRIYKIKLVNTIKEDPILMQVILYRRYLEASIDIRFNKMNFLEKSQYIDKLTLTKIISTADEEHRL